jgi:hypothetical protein
MRRIFVEEDLRGLNRVKLLLPLTSCNHPFYRSWVRMEDDISRYSRMRKLVDVFENINIE